MSSQLTVCIFVASYRCCCWGLGWSSDGIGACFSQVESGTPSERKLDLDTGKEIHVERQIDFTYHNNTCRLLHPQLSEETDSFPQFTQFTLLIFADFPLLIIFSNHLLPFFTLSMNTRKENTTANCKHLQCTSVIFFVIFPYLITWRASDRQLRKFGALFLGLISPGIDWQPVQGGSCLLPIDSLDRLHPIN